HFLHVERRPADDLQNIGGGRLLFQGLCQLPFARLLGLEKASVLDCDYSLIGKAAGKMHLVSREATWLFASKIQKTYDIAVAKKRRDQYTTIAARPGQIAPW